MGKPTGFKEFKRETPSQRPPEERVKDYKELYLPFPTESLQKQGARCMECGIPYCHSGCPLGNVIPEFNDLVYKGRWPQALEMLLRTNNFPEFTGRVCPAPCEASCTLAYNDKAVTIKNIELTIIETAFEKGLVKPRPPKTRTGKKVAVVGSGPAGLAAAAQLNAAGHSVSVFERADRVGGLLLYGIPHFKLDKVIVDRRVALMEAEGITFHTNANVGLNIPLSKLETDFDVIALCGGSTLGRDLKVPGRELKGIHLAMEFLPIQNKLCFGDKLTPDQLLSAKGKHVVVLGGGDTGSDCVGTSFRQGAKSVSQFEIMPKPPLERAAGNPWPQWPNTLRQSSSHEEGPIRQEWCVNTKAFTGENGVVKAIRVCRIEWAKGSDGRMQMKEVPGSEFEVPCDLCLLAMGFVHPEHKGPVEELQLKLDARGNVLTEKNYMTSTPGVFAAGDMRRGQSLVVWAISEGRQLARCVDEFLMGKSDLPRMDLL